MLRSLLIAAFNLLILSFAFSQYVASQGYKVEIEVDNLSGPSTAELFYTAGREFTADLTEVSEIRSGVSTLQFSIPSWVKAVRLDPVTDVGTVVVRRARLKSVVPWVHYEWSAANRFHGVVAQSVVSSTLTEAGLRVETKSDPQLVVRVGVARAAIRRQLIWLEAIALVAFAGSYFWLIRTRPTEAPAHVPLAEVPPAEVRPRRRSVRLLTSYNVYLAVLIAVTASGAWSYHSWRGKKHGVAMSPSRMSLVDQSGEPLIDARESSMARDTGLKVSLDPFMLTRYLPGQRVAGYTIDELGFRGSTHLADPRPKAFLMGGSAAFSLGIGDEQKTLGARLQQQQPGLQVATLHVAP